MNTCIDKDWLCAHPVRTVFLQQGPSFLDDREHRYRIFSFDLLGKRNHASCLEPFKAETMSRLYPHWIGMLGEPGYGILIAQKLSNGDAHMRLGYVGWNGYPVLFRNPLIQHNGESRTWNGREPVWLSQIHIDFIARLIDRKTAVVMLLSKKNAKHHQEAQENRQEAIRASKAALKAYRQRKASARRRQEKDRRLRWEQWATTVLADLRAIHGTLLSRAELKNIEQTEQWL
jgi:hypothetical protein